MDHDVEDHDVEDHDVKNNDVEDQTRPAHDDGGVDHENEHATQEQPLLYKSENGRNHSDGGDGVVDLPFSDPDDESLRDIVEDLEDTTQIQDQPII